MKIWIRKSIIVVLLILFGYILGVSTQRIEANPMPSIQNVTNTQNGLSYEDIYVHGKRVTVIRYGSDIEIVN